MIYELRNIPPYITFNNGYTQQAVQPGVPVTVWLNTLYNREAYDFTLQATGGTVTKISGYEYTVAYAGTGSYTVQLTAFTKQKETVVPPPPAPGDKADENGDLPVKTTAVQPKGIVLLSNILEINIT